MSQPASNNAPIQSYQELRVWQKAMVIVDLSLMLAERLQRDRHYALSNQIERAAISIPANIAEGYGRLHLGDYLRHLSIANGSLKELETLAFIVRNRRLHGREEIEVILTMTAELGRMLTTLLRRLAQRRLAQLR